VGKLQVVAEHHGAKIGACALQFVLAHPAVAAVVPGARSINELDANLDLLATPIPPAVWEEMRHLRLIRADAPTPDSICSSAHPAASADIQPVHQT
jgi:D-threo-aldose 1-dehydrogenase